MKKIIVTGCTGTLGSELVQRLKEEFPPYNIVQFCHKDVDCADYSALKSAIEAEEAQSHVSFIVNCAALVNTVGIENSFETKNRSFESNALIPKYLAAICADLRIKLIHISTDYVFSELAKKSMDSKYDEFPINLYGYHKLIGELYVEKILDSEQFSTLRVGWIYGCQTKRTFVHKFIKNIIDTMKAAGTTSCEVGVVDDQVSTPTSVKFICDGICALLKSEQMVGTVALCPSGSVSKHDYALKILENIKSIFGLDIFDNVKVVRKQTSQKDIGYPKDSQLNSMSEKHIESMVTWQQDLADYMKSHKVDYMDFISELLG